MGFENERDLDDLLERCLVLFEESAFCFMNTMKVVHVQIICI